VYRRQYFGALKTLADIDSGQGRQASARRTYTLARQLLTSSDLTIPSDAAAMREVDRMPGICAADVRASR
jgi:hypothetical protein